MYTQPVLPAPPKHWARTVLALRAAGVLLIALGLPYVLRAITHWAANRDLWLVAGSGAAPASGRFAILTTAIRRSTPLRWTLSHGPVVLAFVGGAYLLARRSNRLVQPPAEPP
jgi:hypothetical protein